MNVPRTVRIGITGPIGCGKTTVGRWLGERPGVVVIDADDVAREVLAVGSAELDAVYARFGTGVALPDASLDRAALARVVFADPVALRDLEAIVHPAVRRRILAAVASAEAQAVSAEAPAASAVVIEAIKLVEGGLGDLCDEIWLVTCHPLVQLDRMAARGMGEADARARIDAQADIAGRLAPHATRIVDTTGSVEATQSIVASAFEAAIARR